MFDYQITFFGRSLATSRFVCDLDFVFDRFSSNSEVSIISSENILLRRFVKRFISALNIKIEIILKIL